MHFKATLLTCAGMLLNMHIFKTQFITNSMKCISFISDPFRFFPDSEDSNMNIKQPQ